jgi:hypothetical protein
VLVQSKSILNTVNNTFRSDSYLDIVEEGAIFLTLALIEYRLNGALSRIRFSLPSDLVHGAGNGLLGFLESRLARAGSHTLLGLRGPTFPPASDVFDFE